MIKNIKNLLFENIGTKQTIFKNTFWLIVAEIIIRALGLAVIIYAARILGATEYGKFAFALSFVSIIVIFADLGLFDITTRELSREKEKEKEYSAILSLKIALSVAVLILILVSSFFITSDFIIRKAIWFLGIFILITSFFNIIYAFLRARQKMEYEAMSKIIQFLLISGLGLFILFTIPSVENLAYGYLIANLISLILILIFFHFFIQPLKLSYDRTIWKKFLKISWPISLGFIAGWILVSVDSIMMGYFGQTAQVGWYNAAYKIIASVVISATLISRSFYPALSRFFKESKEKLQKIWNYQMELMIILAIPTTIGGFIFAPKIINLFYGSGYNPSVYAFQFLVFVCAIDFLYYPYAMALVVSNQQKKNFGLLLTGIVINIILNLALIPRYGFYGAAIATIISSLIIFLLSIVFLKYFTPVSPFNLKLLKVLIMTIISSVVMFLVIRHPLIYNLNLFILILIGGLVYFTSFFASRWFIGKIFLLKVK